MKNKEKQNKQQNYCKSKSDYYNYVVGIDEMLRRAGNPFNITFGRVPGGMVERYDVSEAVIEAFLDDSPESPLFTFVGARGSGKTVTMTKIANYFKEEKDWFVIDLNPHLDMLEQLAAFLYQKGKLAKLFTKSEFSFSFHGISIDIQGDKPVSNILSLLDLMLEYLKKKKIKILLTIDEVVSSKNLKAFAHFYQSAIRNSYPLYLLMSGLYQNLSRLENDKSLTFLFRAPKINLSPLNLRTMAYNYEDLLGLSELEALKAAKLSKGYALAYQLIGYIMYNLEKKQIDETVIKEFDLALDEKSYSKIYSELSPLEKKIVTAIAKDKCSNAEIVEAVGIASNALMVYKKSLSKKGVIDISNRGISTFQLPRFKEFILFQELI